MRTKTMVNTLMRMGKFEFVSLLAITLLEETVVVPFWMETVI